MKRTIHVVVECEIEGSSLAMLDAMEAAAMGENYSPRIECRGAGELRGVHGTYSIRSKRVIEVRAPRAAKRRKSK